MITQEKNRGSHCAHKNKMYIFFMAYVLGFALGFFCSVLFHIDQWSDSVALMMITSLGSVPSLVISAICWGVKCRQYLYAFRAF